MTVTVDMAQRITMMMMMMRITSNRRNSLLKMKKVGI